MINHAMILVVDDSNVDRAVVSSILEKKGFSVVSIPSGKRCLELIDELRPKIVLLDVMMPDCDGNDLLVELRKKYSAIEVPVIMLSSKSDPEDMLVSFNAGANDYLVKPVNFELAMKKIESHLMVMELYQNLLKSKGDQATKHLLESFAAQVSHPLKLAQELLDKVSHREESEEMKNLGTLLREIGHVVERFHKGLT